MRLRGEPPGDTKRENWLQIKGKDEHADANGDATTENFQKTVGAVRSGKSWSKSGSRKNTKR